MQVYSLVALLFAASVRAVSLDTSSKNSICDAAALIANGEWNYYEGLKYGGTIGMFTYPYYWWHAGEAFGGLIDFYTFCQPSNDTLYRLIYNGMYDQRGSANNYIPANQSMTEGNDDQGVWGLATMGAVERNFTDPSDVSWLELTQAIYNTMNARWDTSTCGGGLRWQIFTWNSGYDYKNSIANGCLFHIAARLARYTGNDSYAQTATKVWDWMENDVQFILQDTSSSGKEELVIYDGAKIANNCGVITKTKWSYTYGIFMAGCAYMYNYTAENGTDSESSVWLERTKDILVSSNYFFNNSIMTEMSCAPGDHCNNDQRSFRSLFSRCLALTAVMAPSTYDDIQPLLEKSAVAAAQSCSGGSDGVTCGENWSVNGWDTKFGLGEQMSALEVIQGLLGSTSAVAAPYTSTNGGSSKSNPDAGLDSSIQTNNNVITVSQKDKAGAGVATAFLLAAILGGAIWMVL
ncbi:mannan endo-1,6-alpha-mannosidase Dfg5p [[Candida] anglica]